MTEYVRGVTSSYREYWASLIDSDIIPVKDGGPRLSGLNRLLGRRSKAYYILDTEALDSLTYSNLLTRLASRHGVTEHVVEEWLKEFKIPARLVEKVEKGIEGDRCPGCGEPLKEKGISFCPSCGFRLKAEATPVQRPRIVESRAEEENLSREGTVTQVEEEAYTEVDELMMRMAEFKLTWSKVLLFLEAVHKTFDLESIRFDENGKALPKFRTRKTRGAEG